MENNFSDSVKSFNESLGAGTPEIPGTELFNVLCEWHIVARRYPYWSNYS